MKKRLPNRSPNSLLVFTMRISPEQLVRMEALAEAEGVALRTLGREALDFFLDARKVDSTKACA